MTFEIQDDRTVEWILAQVEEAELSINGETFEHDYPITDYWAERYAEDIPKLKQLLEQQYGVQPAPEPVVPYWSQHVEEFDVKDTWGASVRVEDDPEVGIIVRLKPFEGHEDPSGAILLTDPDIVEIEGAIARVRAHRPTPEERNAVPGTNSDLSLLRNNVLDDRT